MRATGTTRSRRVGAMVLGLVLLTGAFVVAGGPVPTRGTPAGAAVSTNTDPDYATVQFSDPWDFSNAADFTGFGGAQNLASYSMSNGVLNASVNAGGGLILADMIAGAVPLGRSTALHPIRADSLHTVSFRMWADQVGSGGFFWYSCDHVIPSCENGFPFTVSPGWNTYTFNIASEPAFRSGPAWAGVIKGIRLVPSGGHTINIGLDWFRLVPSVATANPPAQPVPLPVVDSPNSAGGADFATVVRGDPWDMSQPSDISAPQNMTYGFNGWLLNGINAGPSPWDPNFTLPLAGPIDGTRFHRLTFRVFYEGAWSLANGPGGGMVARLIWETAGAPGVWQNSDDIVVYPGWNDVTVDLATNPSWAITDPDTANRIGWAGHQITAVRFDPHEDSGARRFLVDDIRIADDAVGYSGATDIQFHDNAWRAGTTADIYRTATRGGFGGTLVASGIPVTQGVNTYHWTPNPIPSGASWLYVVLHRGSATARAYASGPIRMTAARSPLYGVNPLGSFEGLGSTMAGVRARGWALDPDADGPSRVDFWIDGQRPIASTTASGDRPDIANAFPGYGAAHGFDAIIPVPQGTHSVCAYAINRGEGTTRAIGCRTVNSSVNPFGALDAVTATVGGATVRGWAIDPNRVAPINVHIYVDGKPVSSVRAGDARPDIAKAYPAYGSAHGYQAPLTLTRGAHTVCAYGINGGPGANVLLGCKSVTPRARDPRGSITRLTKDRDRDSRLRMDAPPRRVGTIYTPTPMPSVRVLVWLRATPRRRWWVAFLLAAILSGAWAVATPLFGSPDEPAHAIRAAAVAEGKLKGTETKGLVGIRDGSVIYRVPGVFVHANDSGCFAFQRNKTADCFHFDHVGGTVLVATSAGNYPPAYYAIVGLPSRFFDSGFGVYLMRLVSALIAAALLASALVTLDRFPRPRLMALGLAVAITPMVLFLNGTVNPNSVEISAAIGAWIAVIALAAEAARGLIDTRLVVRASVALGVLALARTISPLWVLAIVGSGAVLAGWTASRLILRTRATQIGAAVVALAVVAQVAWTAYANPLASSENSGAKHLSDYLIQRTVLGKGADLYRSMIGVFGWLDTPSPFGLTVLWTLVLGVVVLLGFTLATRRQLLVLAGVTVLTVIVPIVGELSEVHSSGFFWQGRYTLPLAVGVPIVAAAIAARAPLGRLIPARLPIIGVAVLGLCQVVDFGQALRRYMVGYDGALQFWTHPAWEPPIPGLVLTLGFLVAIVAYTLWLVGPGADDIATDPAPSPDHLPAPAAGPDAALVGS